MVTINDVAKLAGVSRGTVSNVINNVKVRPEHKEKVEKAIRELGYVPNAYARGLKSNRTNTVAFILPTVWFPFFSELTNDLERELRKLGYKMLLCNSYDDYKLELEYIQMARENKVDGIISITYSDIEEYLGGEIPLVAVERYFDAKIPFISTDNFDGGAQAANKLAELGCKKLWFVGRLAEKDNVTALRRGGFTGWCLEHGMPYEELYSKAGSEAFMEEIDREVERRCKEGLPDGIFAATDRYARYVLDALRKRGYGGMVGKEIQIIGFDGSKTHRHDRTYISSMRQPVEEIALRAANTLDSLIKGKPVEMYTLLPVKFVQGETTAVQP